MRISVILLFSALSVHATFPPQAQSCQEWRLRSTTGPSPRGEFGLAYVSEDFNIADDQHYPATTWSIDASSDILGEKTRLYLKQFGLWNLEDRSDLVVDTTLGIAVPLIWNFEAAAEALLEYDSGAVQDVQETDQTYRLRIGYNW